MNHVVDLVDQFIQYGKNEAQVDDGNGGKIFYNGLLVADRGFYIGRTGQQDVELWRLLQDTRGEHYPEIRLQAVPFDFPEAGDDRLELHSLNVEAEGIADV